jgi:hypothetical protein
MPNEIPEPPTDPQERVADLDVQQAIERLCEGEPDALYLLSGVSEITNPETGEKTYKPGSYKDVDWNGYMTGGKGRALAVVELAKRFSDAKVAVNSNTFNVRYPEAPTDAEVMAEYVERRGVPPEKIIKQDRSTTTFTELIELIKYIAEYRWKHTVVVAGETQLPRTEEMFRQIGTLQDPAGAWKDPDFRAALEEVSKMKSKITFVSSEDVLPFRDERYTKVIAEARNTETWKIREALDEKAVEDLRTGKYWKN